MLAISFCLISILAILADTSLEGKGVDAGVVIRSSRLVVSSPTPCLEATHMRHPLQNQQEGVRTQISFLTAGHLESTVPSNADWHELAEIFPQIDTYRLAKVATFHQHIRAILQPRQKMKPSGSKLSTGHSRPKSVT